VQLPDSNRQCSAATAPTRPIPHHSAVLDNPRKSSESHGSSPRRPSPGSAATTKAEELIQVEAKLPDQRDIETQPLEKDAHTIRRNTGHIIQTNTNLANLRIVETNCLLSGMEIGNVNKDYEQKETTTSQYIPPIGQRSRTDQYTKPTPQPEKTVGQKPTAADKISNTKMTDGNHKTHSATNDRVDTKRQIISIQNSNITEHNDISNTTTLTQLQNTYSIPTMSAPDPHRDRDRVDEESNDSNEEATNNSAARPNQQSPNSSIVKDRHKPHQALIHSPS